MTLEQTIEIPANHRIILEIPSEVPVGRARVELKFIPETSTPESEPEIPGWLKGKICEKAFGKGKILGDIIGPFHDVWESRD